MKLLMVRHGEIPSNVNKVYAGRSPEELTEKGLQQARQLSGKLEQFKVDALYSSPIQRALQTARIFGEAAGMDPVVDDSFRELELGPWEGMSESDISEEYPEQWVLWNKDPDMLNLEGRETLNDLLERILDGVRAVNKKHPGKSVVIVTHVAIIRVLLLWCAGKSLNLYKTIHVPNAEVFEIDLDKCPAL